LESVSIEKYQNTIKTQSEDIKHKPGVTIGIPVLNEEDHIERVVNGFLNTRYPNLVEILIADGGSTDRTRHIVKKLSAEDSRVKLLDNPEKYQSFALNKMIEQAKGEVFLRADGHCIYANDYLEKSVGVLVESGARNAGGSQRYVARNRVQAGVAMAVKSFLGNGGARYMDETYEGYADTVFLGCFWTKDLRDLGGFSTSNITNQDSEMNLRIIENFGESVMVSPEIKSWYYPRDSYLKLFKQYFKYGRGRFITRSTHPKSTPLRGLTPFLFVFFLIVYLLIDFNTEEILYSGYFLFFIAVVLIVEMGRTVWENRISFEEEIWQSESKKPGILSRWVHSIISILTMQIGHFSGVFYQMIRKLVFGKKGW